MTEKHQALYRYSLLILVFMLFLLFVARPLGLMVIPVLTPPIYPIKLPYQVTVEPLTIMIISLVITVVGVVLGSLYKRHREATVLNFIDMGIIVFTIITTGGLIT